ncbi:Uncharacterized protein APZ42_025422 [Daphnia magna]|uniref:Uncharacterized protein n=1 Tax=Daphnia magna TaxID=35525 RepID=A0A164T418_9CRUS|nr:Uncharacterized protein APZ42_025422 [Daphnia magna]
MQCCSSPLIGSPAWPSPPLCFSFSVSGCFHAALFLLYINSSNILSMFSNPVSTRVRSSHPDNPPGSPTQSSPRLPFLGTRLLRLMVSTIPPTIA